MRPVRELIFDVDDVGQLPLPVRCTVDVSCLESPELQEAVTNSLRDSLYMVAYAGIDLKDLDGITVAQDCEAVASALQDLQPGQVALDVSPQPGSMELARTATVRRDDKLKFHIVVRPGLSVMTLSPDKQIQRLAQGCIAHEAAHVEHESHLYRMFPEGHGKPLECGHRSRQTFLKALDVWSEYAACRSSAAFRPEAQEEFEQVLSRAIEECSGKALDQIKAHREGQDAASVFRELQQIFGDVFIYAGYLLGHVHGLELNLSKHFSSQQYAFLQQPKTKDLVFRLERILNELWLTEFVWESIEVFVPIYDLICEMMAQHGMIFVRHGDEWRIVMYDDQEASGTARDALSRWQRPTDA